MPIKSPVTPTGHGRLTAGGDGLEPCALPIYPAGAGGAVGAGSVGPLSAPAATPAMPIST